MNLKGYIKLHRKMIAWEWMNHPPTLCVFIHLLLKASYEEEHTNRGTLYPGQVMISLNQLAKDTGLSQDQVRTALAHLQKTGEIILTTSRGSWNSIATLTNWPRYQEILGASQSFETSEPIVGQDSQAPENYGNPEVYNEKSESRSFSQSLPRSFSQSLPRSSETPEALNDNGSEPKEEQEARSSSQSSAQSSARSSSQTIYKRNNKKDKNIKKNIYGEFVQLTDDEYQKLLTRFGKPFLDKCIDKLNNYLGSKGDKYKSHYYVINGWVKDSISQQYPGLMKPQPSATTTETQPEADHLAEWGGSL